MQAPSFLQRQTGALAMTPRLQQSIALLQRSNLETAEWLIQEVETNPLVELDGFGSVAVDPADTPDGVADRLEDWLGDAPLDTLRHDEDSGGIIPEDGDGPFERARTPSLRERLDEQLRLSAFGPGGTLIGAALLAMLDPAGRLDGTPAELAAALGVALSEVERIRGAMMLFDPPGCFACSLAECLAAQLRARNRLDPAMQALLDHLDLLATGDLARLRARCGVDEEDFADMLTELRALDPKPGFEPETAGAPALPDVLVRRDGAGWRVDLNDDTLPRLRIDRTFAAALSGRADTRGYARERLSHAEFLARALAQRSRSILAISRAIVARQHDFLDRGVEGLRPMTLRQIAEATGLHESTVSRVTSQRFIGTLRGVLPLRAFFSTALAAENGDGETHSAEAIRHRIRALIAAESPDAVLSDDALTVTLQAEGITIMRRTVAKYRESLDIPNSAHRRRMKKAGL
ncbi:RNA polymerase factor sigma-54 [Acidomonas methanolica]|uniref:RNA polymerase factor sigma-54 n=1 Tax=Acidomonas methanolica TaxID=437 RepID=UPI002119EC0C|nr:RNA polymerase factor sigma-54 [Acidomonas methanolica]MCQ9155335.1 RNA polymerase factor sigma-54 [Acidomonas methanolica]